MKEKKKEEQDSMWELELEFHVDFSPHQLPAHETRIFEAQVAIVNSSPRDLRC